jgi:hypothetical protein
MTVRIDRIMADQAGIAIQTESMSWVYFGGDEFCQSTLEEWADTRLTVDQVRRIEAAIGELEADDTRAVRLTLGPLDADDVRALVSDARERGERADLRGVDLTGECLAECDLRWVDLADADLRAATEVNQQKKLTARSAP